MRRKLGKTEVLALIAAAGVTTCAAQAAKVENGARAEVQSLQVTEQTSRTQLGSDSACGKGSCGTDESGAKAAAAKHAKTKAVKKAAQAKKEAKEAKEASGEKKGEEKKAEPKKEESKNKGA